MPCFKGFRKLSILFGKFIFKLLAFFVGNLFAMFYLALVASKQGTPTTTKPTIRNEDEIRLTKGN
jgi:hypothetical protein